MWDYSVDSIVVWEFWQMILVFISMISASVEGNVRTKKIGNKSPVYSPIRSDKYKKGSLWTSRNVKKINYRLFDCTIVLLYIHLFTTPLTVFCFLSIPTSIRSSKESPNTWRASMLDFRGSSKQEVNSSTEQAIFKNSSAPGPSSFANLRSFEFA